MIILQNVNPNKLLDELIAAGIESHTVTVISDIKKGEHIADNTQIIFNTDIEQSIINDVVENHDPTPLPSPPTETDFLRDYLLGVDLRLIMMELGL